MCILGHQSAFFGHAALDSVEVATHLPFPLLSHLRVVVRQRHTLREAAGWDELTATLRARPIGLLVVDPVGPGDVDVERVAELRLRFPSIPIIAYTVLSPVAMQAMVQLVKAGVEQVVLHRVDDEPKRFLALIDRQHGYLLGDQILASLSGPMARLANPLGGAVTRLFREPERYRSATDLAIDAGCSTRHLSRQFEQAGFATPKIVVDSARLLRAFGYLMDPGCALENAAEKLGYSAPRILANQLEAAIGMRGRALRRQNMEPGEFVTLLAQRIQLNGG